jgi:hypothetical protein
LGGHYQVTQGRHEQSGISQRERERERERERDHWAEEALGLFKFVSKCLRMHFFSPFLVMGFELKASPALFALVIFEIGSSLMPGTAWTTVLLFEMGYHKLFAQADLRQ